jgi:hypothetical protein
MSFLQTFVVWGRSWCLFSEENKYETWLLCYISTHTRTHWKSTQCSCWLPDIKIICL